MKEFHKTQSLIQQYNIMLLYLKFLVFFHFILARISFSTKTSLTFPNRPFLQLPTFSSGGRNSRKRSIVTEQ